MFISAIPKDPLLPTFGFPKRRRPPEPYALGRLLGLGFRLERCRVLGIDGSSLGLRVELRGQGLV